MESWTAWAEKRAANEKLVDVPSQKKSIKITLSCFTDLLDEVAKTVSLTSSSTTMGLGEPEGRGGC